MSKITETYHCPPNVDCPCYTKMWDEIYRLRAELALVRKATLEEAAKVAEGLYQQGQIGGDIAAAIRKLGE